MTYCHVKIIFQIIQDILVKICRAFHSCRKTFQECLSKDKKLGLELKNRMKGETEDAPML